MLSDLQNSCLYVVIFIDVQFPLGLLSNIISGMIFPWSFESTQILRSYSITYETILNTLMFFTCFDKRYDKSIRAEPSGDRIPVGGKIFHTRPDRPWGPSSLLYNGHRVSFPGVRWPGRGVNHPPPSSAEDEERVELYLYTSSRSSWPVLGWTLPLPLPLLYDKRYDFNHIKYSRNIFQLNQPTRCSNLSSLLLVV
jgi:hypothetical protein